MSHKMIKIQQKRHSLVSEIGSPGMQLASGMTRSGDSKTIPPRFWLFSVFPISQLGDSLLNSFSLSRGLFYHVVGEEKHV